MEKDIRTFLKSCEQSGKNKHDTHSNQAPVQLTDVPDESLDKLLVDFLGPFQPSTAHENKYALHVQDILSWYLMLLPTEEDNAETASDEE